MHNVKIAYKLSTDVYKYCLYQKEDFCQIIIFAFVEDI